MLRVVRNVKFKTNVNFVSSRNITSQTIDEWNSLISSRGFTARDDETKVGPDKILLGTTFIAKDNIATTKEPTTCASCMLDNYYSPFDATVISLLEEQGLTMVGKANLDEFGMGSANVNSYYGHAVNPLFTEEEHITGGSSGDRQLVYKVI